MGGEYDIGEDDSLMRGPAVKTFLTKSDDPEIPAEVLPKSESNITISFNDLSYSIRPKARGKGGKEVLLGIDGYFRGSCLNVLIGPSGAGKTSLLSILCGLRGRKEGVRGHVAINGSMSTADTLRKLACYIPQEFELLPLLTTRETLYFAAKLKVPGSDEKKINALVMRVASTLGLQNCLSTMTGNLSGGEKKRLSIGVEIVVNPRVLVLDEPTSGLDSAASLQVIILLKNIAQSGCTVICSVHQPSSQMMTHFDEMLVLAEGRDLYCGPASKIVETFGEAGFSCPPFYNISEFVIEVITGQHGGDLDNLRNYSEKFQVVSNKSFVPVFNGQEDAGRRVITKNTGRCLKQKCDKWFNEFRMLIWRSTKCILRDNTLTKLRLTAHILVGIFMGLVFYKFGGDASKVPSNIACLFFFLLFLFFSNAMPSVQMFPIEAEVFAREHMNNWYGLGTYHVTKVLTDLPLQTLCPTFFLVIAYCMTGQPVECDRFMKSWLICFLLCILAQSFGMLTGAAVHTHAGTFLVPALNIPMCLFSGFFLKLGEVPSYMTPISFLSYFRYSFEGLMLAVYGGDRGALPCPEEFCILRAPNKILRHMDMPSLEFSSTVYALVSWIALLHLCIYGVLRWKSTRSM
ncbi:ATP-binding cassette sub-family G member 4 [Diachasma alloeum]|uniref:ATP-binding cassette sub-family G member 4 n=1 Tax=Diachasma alloeum TaxID=454923 RepID=UPI0007382597|nr:ATP-binding cassette sub-family G member 4 [Diachasma alloeum]